MVAASPIRAAVVPISPPSANQGSMRDGGTASEGKRRPWQKKKERKQGLGYSPCGCETNAESAMHLLCTPKLSWTHARRGLGDMLTSRIGQLWLVWPCVWAYST